MTASAWKNWPEWALLGLFAALTGSAMSAPFLCPVVQNDPRFGQANSAILAIGTSGLVAFIFYYVVNYRLDRRRRELIRQSALRTYRHAKHDIAVAIIHASEKGGRHDLRADSETIEKALTISGFKELFEGGREADEGFYAFQNQMSDQTPEFDEIIFNFKIMSRTFERIVDSAHGIDAKSYNYFVHLDGLLRRIERNSAGYDESKLLCRVIWEVFTGRNMADGYTGHDPIEKAIEEIT